MYGKISKLVIGLFSLLLALSFSVEANFAREKIEHLNDVMSHAFTYEEGDSTAGENVRVIDMGYAGKGLIDCFNVSHNAEKEGQEAPQKNARNLMILNIFTS